MSVKIQTMYFSNNTVKKLYDTIAKAQDEPKDNDKSTM